jgi:hypothetical protein
MKKFIIGLITCLLLINSSYCQEATKKDSIAAFKKLNKWAVVKLTIAYIEDLRGWSSDFEEKKISKNQKQEWGTYKKLNNEYSEFRNDLNLDSVAKILSKGWGETRAKIFQHYRLELIDSVKINNFNTVGFTPEKTKTNNSNRTKVLELISSQYDKLIPKKNNELSNASQKVVTPKNLKKRTFIQKEGIDWPQMILYVFLLLSLIFNVFSLHSILKNKNGNKGKKGNYEDFYKSQSESLKEENRKLKEEVSQLKTKKTTIREPSNFKRKGITQVERNIEIQKPIEDAKPIIVEFKDPEIKNNFIYFPSPFEERRFAIEDASPVEKPTSLYVANVNKNTNKGDISLIETADLSRALNSPNIYLETVCEYENAYNSEAKGIKVVEDGEVILDGEDWVVKSKIKIKFI